MNDRHPRPTEPVDRPLFWEPSPAFLKYGFALILAGSAAILAAIFIFAPDQPVRAIGPVSMSLVAVAAWVLLARGRIEAAVHVLAYGLWMAVTGIAFFTGGVHSTISIVYPQIILLLGWMIGTRAALAIAVLTMVTALGFALAESWGFLPLPPPTPPVMRWIIQSFVVVSAVILITYFVRAYQDRLREAGKLGRELALRTAEVQAREADLNRAQAVAEVGSWVYELATDTMRLSAETCRIFGLPEGTAGSRDAYLSRIHPEDRSTVDHAWQAAIRGGAPFDSEHRILVRKTIRWVRQKAKLEFDADLTALRGVGTTQDITERKQAEASLLQSEANLRAMTDYAPLGIAVIQDGRRVFANRQAAALLGYSVEEFAQRSIFDLVHPDYRVRMLEMYRQRLAGEAVPDKAEYMVLAKDGRAITIEAVFASTVWNGQAAMMLFSADITERMRLEQALRTQTERLLIGQRAVGMVIVEWDILKNEPSWSDSPEWLRGPLPESGTYPVYIEQVHPDDRDHFRAVWDEGIHTLQPRNHEYRIVRTDGRVLWVRSQQVLVPGADGNAARMLVVQQDITDRKQAEARQNQLEAQLRESQKMEALGTLAGGIAHDFNNIVATILGNVELARQDVGPGHTALESLEEIDKASRRAKDLVQQILAFGRRQLLERNVISLAPVVEESARLLRSTLPAGVSLRVECVTDAPAVMADATQVQQVLLNLCANAWQAMQGQKRPAAIELSLAPHMANRAQYKGLERRSRGGRAALRPGRYACRTVRDNGPGMDQATVARIFEPFFTTKAVGKGTGLGLAVVHGIVQSHGADIDVHSAPGEGTTFRIYFPAAERPVAAVAAQAPDSAPAHGEGKSILYVDDDEAIVFLMTRLLERQGYLVRGYTDAREALAAVRSQPDAFDLVVTDYNMPGLSGLEVAHALREIRADLPVALASGYITEELRAQAPAAGVSELVYKPNTVDELCAVVARLANAQRGKQNSS